MDAFKETISKQNLCPQSNDLVKGMYQLVKDRTDEMNKLAFERSLSALIGIASLMVQSTNINISSFQLDIPSFVKADLHNLLPPYLNAVQIDGYQKRRTRKAFCVGNTGN